MPNENVNVTTTNTFLDKTTPITMDDLKSQFQADDFSAAESGYDLTRQPTEKQKLYQRVKTLFDQAWENELKKLRGKSGKNYGADYPLKALEKSESELVAGTVMKITENPELHDKYMNAGTKAMMSRVNEIATEYEGREEETGVAEKIADRLADKFLAHMMGLLLKTQNVPEILGVVKSTPAHEDFTASTKDNRDKIDFDRKWNHSRTKIGAMLSLDELAEQEASGQTEIPSVEMSLPEENEAEIIRQFCNTLDGKDREIFQLKAKGKTQREIANLLGYKSQGAVSKRLHRIEKQFREFLRERT